MEENDAVYDVIIIGTGLSGTMLGSILAKQGRSVLLLDGAQHPRFAVGESTIGQTLFLFELLAFRYGVPEIANLSSFQKVSENVGGSHGQKNNFGFIMNRDGEEPAPHENNMLRLLDVAGNAAHFFRQDTDAYMFHTAVKYGCTARQNFRVDDLDLAEDGVTVTGVDGTVFRGRFLVDASGFRSPLARQLGLRETPSRLQHHARSLFTHMIGVDPIDDHLNHPEEFQPPAKWNEGTLHHVFDGGWLWIIPFNNHPGATNPLCSVGLQLDPRMYPLREDLSAEEEFWEHVRRFPAVQRQLEGARSVREWIRTDRMQYSSSQTVGHRWCLMSHAAGFIDPLYSRGLSNTCEIINSLVWRLLAALDDDDFSVERFRYVEQLEQGLLDYNDKLVSASYIAWRNYDLWNAVFRIWSAGSVIGGKRFRKALARTLDTGEDAYCQQLDDDPYPGLWWPSDFYHDLFEEVVGYCVDVREGRMDAQKAADILCEKIRTSDWMVPALGFNDLSHRVISPSEELMKQVTEWAASHPRKEIRDVLG
ncbi:MAG: tryptophan 7-halogenase [Actinocatenispora sp.]